MFRADADKSESNQGRMRVLDIVTVGSAVSEIE